MKDCKECGQTIENCECHIPSKEKHKGLSDLCKMKPKGTFCQTPDNCQMSYYSQIDKYYCSKCEKTGFS